MVISIPSHFVPYARGADRFFTPEIVWCIFSASQLLNSDAVLPL